MLLALCIDIPPHHHTTLLTFLEHGVVTQNVLGGLSINQSINQSVYYAQGSTIEYSKHRTNIE